MNGDPAPSGDVIINGPGSGFTPKKKKKRSKDSEALTQLALELLAVALFTLMAGASNEMGTLVLLFMVGMWMIYLIQNSKVIAKLEKALEAA